MTRSRSKSIPDHEIIIVGGGICGAAVAYGLAARGCRVTLIDAPTRTNMASRANVGLIWCQSKFLHLPDYARWGFHSARLFPELTRELQKISGIEIPVHYRGGIIACLGEGEYDTRREYIENLGQVLDSYPGGMISRGELEKKLPHIKFGKEVSGAAWCEEDGIIEPLALLRAFKVAFSKLGGTFIETVAYEVQPRNGGFLVITEQGPLNCERVVLAAGLANRRLARFALPELPVYADKGQVLLVERMPYVMPIPVLGVSQTFGGTVIIGFRHEFSGHDTGIVPEDVATEGIWATRVWPELGKKRLIRAWSGLRVMPEDKQAIYSTLPGHPRAFLLNTHSAVTLAAAHARYLPDFIVGAGLPDVAASMTLKRFGYDCQL
ncbi:NAD(P)/FAD-dependent oxidoreductase [Desulforhopalus singaporensis]|uniref:Glycine/D-amino acid oxidase n=1 Tax=Desulforhopalus singaporensis TaxID=91360 RepID=A0A1H0PJL3_9BACT|nr:FAD-dependent oxidoreductase [Desulforhopalus singaporensis]SDP05312.1 Glycine/D-amino acid oxidase [Desulforhopalus singaporensis]